MLVSSRRRSTVVQAREARHDDALSLLVYELLDAHDDTMRLGEELVSDLRWQAHLDYLRGLQRVGREALARGTGDDPARPSRRLADLFRRLRRLPVDGEVVLP